jgi:glycosyltransferase involved in cell wall biosynthesis
VRIALDTRWMRPGRIDGIGRHVAELTRALLETAGDTERYLLLFDDPASAARFAESLTPGQRERAELVAAPAGLLTRGDLARVPRWLRGLRPTLYHAPNYLTSPLHRGYRRLSTVHDLIPLGGRRGARGERLAWRLFFCTSLPTRLLLTRADHLVAVSETTRRGLEALGVPARRITVVPNGVAPVARAQADAPAGGLPAGVGPGFLLYVGRLAAHKGVEGGLRAFSLLPAPLRRRHPFLLCGPAPAGERAALEEHAQALGVAGEVRVLGPVAEPVLDALYRQAALLLHPAEEEGFGLTPLEAMVRGTPVVALRIPALVEHLGESACLVPPGDPEGLAQALRRLLEDGEEREALGARGRERAAAFSWRRAAEQTRAIYRRLLAGGERGEP